MSTFSYTDPSNPLLQKTAKENPEGFSAAGMARLIQIESSGVLDASSLGGKYLGLVQIGEDEFLEYGPRGGSRTNPNDSIYALGKMGANIGQYLHAHLKRKPTDAEMYIAWQQGMAGAVKLLENQKVRAGNLVGDDHIRENGGNPNEAASIFTNMWIQRFNNKA